MMNKNCNCSENKHCMMMPDCCQEHKMSKEHLKAKKEILEKTLKWINEELGKK